MLRSIAATCVVFIFLSGTGWSADETIEDRRKAFNEAIQNIKKKYKNKSDSKKMHEELGQKKVAFSCALVVAANRNKNKEAADKLRNEYYPLLKEIKKHGEAGAAVIMPVPTFPRKWVSLPDDGIIRLTEEGTMPEKYDITSLLDYLNYGRAGEASSFKLNETTVRLHGKESGKDGFYARNDSVGRDYIYLFYLRSNIEQDITFQVNYSKGDKIEAVYVNLKKASGKGRYKSTMREGINLILIIFNNAKKTDMKVQLKIDPGKKKKSKGEEPKLETADFWAG